MKTALFARLAAAAVSLALAAAAVPAQAGPLKGKVGADFGFNTNRQPKAKVVKPNLGKPGTHAEWRRLMREYNRLKAQQVYLLKLRRLLLTTHVAGHHCMPMTRQYAAQWYARRIAYYHAIGRADLVRKMVRGAHYLGRLNHGCVAAIDAKLRAIGNRMYAVGGRISQLRRQAMR